MSKIRRYTCLTHTPFHQKIYLNTYKNVKQIENEASGRQNNVEG